MNWIIEKLFNVFSYPVRWFWTEYEKCKQEQKILKLIALFIISLSGLGIFCTALIILIILLSQHIDFVVITGIIIWVYAYIRSKMNDKKNEQPVYVQQDMYNTYQCAQEEMLLHEQAAKCYPLMRNILYQVLREMAENIGGKTPRFFEEIETKEDRYFIRNGICFYQFTLDKADPRARYQREEVEEFQRMLQYEISNQIQRGSFPTLQFHSFMDQYGNIYDAVLVDTIQDLEAHFLIYAVFYSHIYADYLRQKSFSFCDNYNVPNAEWNPKL